MRGSYSGFDLYQKPVDGLRSKTISGAVITIVAASITFILFLSQIYLYAKVDVSNHLSISMPDKFKSLEALLVGTAVMPNLVNSRDGKSRGHFQIPIKFHVTFPHIKCHDLDMTYNGASGENFRKVIIFEGTKHVLKMIEQ